MEEEIKSAKEKAEEKAEKIMESQTEKDEKSDIRNEPVQITFSSYILMLGAIGWQSLGKVPNPVTGKIEKDLIQAKEIIDLLEILDLKTKNNLTPEEDNILKQTLTNLRLNYIDEIKKGGS